MSQVVSVRLSPDGKQAAVSSADAAGQNQVVWLLDFARGANTRFTFGSAAAVFPVWSPDGSRIIFSSGPQGPVGLYQKPANGATDEQLLLKGPGPTYADSWSRDGRFFLYTEVSANGKASLWVLPLEGDKKPFPFLATEFNEERGRFSPDGHWIAYASDESGRYEVYVRPFSHGPGATASDTGGKWLVSTAGGTDPRWRGNGKELYYLAPDGKLMAVEVATDPEFHAGVPKALFQAPLGSNGAVVQWDVTADGKHFLIPAPTQAAQTAFTVVLNWPYLLKK
jgi:eukaryotic-like serine/threonine-protein kinase